MKRLSVISIFYFISLSPLLSQSTPETLPPGVTLPTMEEARTCEPSPKFGTQENSLSLFLSETIIYPADAKASKIDGTVFLGFVIEKDGRMSNIGVKRSIHPSLDAEALRVVQSMPAGWTSGQVSGMPARCVMTLPIKFALE